MASVLMREIQCPNCGRPTRHRIPILERMIQLQSATHDGERYINYACPYCKHLTHARVETEGRIYLEEDSREFPTDLTLYVVYLECAKKGCKSRVILLAPVKREIAEEGLWRLIHNEWRNHKAVCAEGHQPFFPLKVEKWELLTA